MGLFKQCRRLLNIKEDLDKKKKRSKYKKWLGGLRISGQFEKLVHRVGQSKSNLCNVDITGSVWVCPHRDNEGKSVGCRLCMVEKVTWNYPNPI